MKLYLYNTGHNGDIITSRATINRILRKYPNLEIMMGCYKDHEYLLKDLPINIVTSELTQYSGVSNLRQLCPENFIPISLWLGTYSDILRHDWESQVIVFNRQTASLKIFLDYDENDIPMIDFNYQKSIQVLEDSIYLDNSVALSGQSKFTFDVNLIADKFPKLNFYCTAGSNSSKTNVIDSSNRNLVELSEISEGCKVIIGKGSGPFLCTYSEINKYKPRAVVGFQVTPNRPGFQKFWDYPDNPIKYIYTVDDIIEFIKINF